MITKIILNNCTPYKHAELTDCSKINFVFGANGSGKSTIGALLEGASEPRLEQSSVEWDSVVHETIYVYNRAFRRRNFQQTIPGVFTMGTDTIEDINELERLKADLSLKKDDWGKRSESYRKIVEITIPEREKKFKEDAWKHILKSNEADFKKAFEGLRNNKDNFIIELKRRIKGIPGHKGTVCKREDLLERAKTLYAEKPVKCEPFSIDIEEWLEQIKKIQAAPIWNTVIAGNQDIDIAALIDELRNTSWVKEGRQFLKQNSKVCPFCQQETITDDFKLKLEAFFDSEYTSRVDLMEASLNDYKKAATHIISTFDEILVKENSIIVGKLDTEMYTAKKSILISLFKENERRIEDKIKEPGIKVIIEDVTAAIDELKVFLDSANEIINYHNTLVTEREITETELKDDVWATVIHESESLINYYKTDISNLEKAAKGIKRSRDSKKTEIDRLELEVIEKGKNITSVQPTINEINKSLKAYGFTSFSIQPSREHDNYYCIMRDDGSLATDTLSEGEETFLTFLYFMQWTKGSIDPLHVSDKKIIVLDDPISSLDSTILYIVGTMVKRLSLDVREGKGDVNQLFVLTHNVFFHKEASFVNGRTTELSDVNYWIVRKDNSVSTIKSYGMRNPISTAYELLWQELRDNDNLSQITLQNTMRRIIENYFGMLGGKKDELLINLFTEPEDQIIARSLLAWLNDGSHSIPDDLFIDSYSDAVPKYKEVFKRMFYESGNQAHYDMMMKIIDIDFQEVKN